MTIDRKEPGFGFGSFLLGSGSLSHSLMRTPRIPREVIGMETRLQRGSKRNVQMNKHFTVTKLYYILYYTIYYTHSISSAPITGRPWVHYK